MTASAMRTSDFGAVEHFLAAVKMRCAAEMGSTPVARPAQTLLRAGGKQLRARLLWWSAQATANRDVRPDDATLVQAAAAIELAHLGSLLHDDIVDAAENRRGAPALHREHGARIAADAGASLAHLASMLFAPLGAHTRHAVRRATLALCRGQVRELAQACVIVSPRARVAIMQEKTAALFELTAGLGAALVGADRRQRAAVKRFARRFGVAFQIADDVLDLAGDPAELGRSNGADLREGVMSLPVLLAAARDPRLVSMLSGLHRSPSAAAVADCAARVARSGGIAEAAEVARWWLARGIAALDTVAPGTGRAALEDLARSSVARGLTPGQASYSASAVVMAPALFATMRHRSSAAARAFDVDSRLARSLDWIFPGFSAIVGNVDAGTATVRSQATRTLLRGRAWSLRGRMAAAAIAHAHALAHDEALRCEPVRTIALADCLHCLAIAVLCDGDDDEHQRIAARARSLQPYAPPDVAGRPQRPAFENWRPLNELNV
jgi:heptaprenyl diphosphate synthase